MSLNCDLMLDWRECDIADSVISPLYNVLLILTLTSLMSVIGHLLRKFGHDRISFDYQTGFWLVLLASTTSYAIYFILQVLEKNKTVDDSPFEMRLKYGLFVFAFFFTQWIFMSQFAILALTFSNYVLGGYKSIIRKVTITMALLLPILSLYITSVYYRVSEPKLSEYCFIAACMFWTVVSILVLCILCRRISQLLTSSASINEEEQKHTVHRIRHFLYFGVGVHCFFLIVLILRLVNALTVEERDSKWQVAFEIAFTLFYVTAVMSLGAVPKTNSVFSDKGLSVFQPTLVVFMGASAGKDVQVQTVDKSKMKKSVSMVLPTDSPEHKLTVSSIKLAREMLWTRKNFFTFPHPVNVVDARIHALCTMTGVTLHCALMYFADFPYMYIWLGYGFLARTLCGPRIDPQAWFVLFISPKIWFLPKEYEAGPPKRIAQATGFVFTLASALLYATGQTTAAYWVISMLFMFAAQQAFYTYCPPCMMFYIAALFKLIPESIEKKYKVAFVPPDKQLCDICSVRYRPEDIGDGYLSSCSYPASSGVFGDKKDKSDKDDRSSVNSEGSVVTVNSEESHNVTTPAEPALPQTEETPSTTVTIEV